MNDFNSTETVDGHENEPVAASEARGLMGDILTMFDVGFSLSLGAIGHQLEAMPATTYFVRLIHCQTRKPFPGERLWAASQLMDESTLRFLRARNREGFEIYFRPYAGEQNAGYILLDLDNSALSVITAMRVNGHEPCVVVETSPGHFQAWIRIRDTPLAPARATHIARHLALLYHGDRASADWRHIGRLAGFTNRKPQRRLSNGWPPWVRLQAAQPCMASNGDELVAAAPPQAPQSGAHKERSARACSPPDTAQDHTIDTSTAVAIYQTWLTNLQILQRFAGPDWSIADLWIAKTLLQRGLPGAQVKSILRLASPGFPRSHSDPEDYLRRTLVRALRDTSSPASFPARPITSSTIYSPRRAPLCVP